METTNGNPATALEMDDCRPATANHAVLIASALFAAGITSFTLLMPRHDGKTVPEAAPRPAPSALDLQSAATEPPAVPLFPSEASLAPQYEDGLVPVSLPAPVVNEAPLLPAAAAPQVGAAARVETPAAFHGPMVEISKARARLSPLPWLSGQSHRVYFAGGPRAQAAAILAAARRMAVAAGPVNNDPAYKAYRAVTDANGGMRYTSGNTNDFRQGYGKVCGLAGYHCTPQANGMVIQTPDGAQVSHSYNPLDRNHILVTLQNGQTANLSHCPLVFDLGGHGVRTSDRPVRYDIDGKGRIARIQDIASDSAVLVFDADHTGIAGQNGRGLFGDGTDLDGDGLADGFRDGFEALDAFVRKAEKEGVLAAGTLESGKLTSADLAALHKAYGLGLRKGSLGARTVPPAEAGVREIALSKSLPVRVADFDGQGNDVVRRQGAAFTRADGSVGSYEDIFFNYRRPGFQQLAWAR